MGDTTQYPFEVVEDDTTRDYNNPDPSDVHAVASVIEEHCNDHDRRIEQVSGVNGEVRIDLGAVLPSDVGKELLRAGYAITAANGRGTVYCKPVDTEEVEAVVRTQTIVDGEVVDEDETVKTETIVTGTEWDE